MTSERPPYLPDSLTESQTEAILHRGFPLLIIAGPGAGKTEVIAWRVAHLVRSGQARSENMLVTTFTNKAALELKDRIQAKLPDINVELMQVSTIHSFCADLLRRHRYLTSFPHGFRVLDDADQLLFVYANRKALGLGDIAKGQPARFYDDALRCFNLATEELVDPDSMETWCRSQHAACSEDEADLWQERSTIAEAYRRYRALLVEKGLMDFGHLQVFALALLEEHPEVVPELQHKYVDILVDEYQDTNAAQDRLLSILAGAGERLTVVGDDDQSIYRFRGATVRNLRSFPERFPNTRIVTLAQNFRSREQIVELTKGVITHNPARYPKDLLSMRGRGCDVLLVYERTAREEASAVAGLLRRLHQAGHIHRWEDVTVLLRSVRSYSEPYLEAFAAAGIPYYVIGDASLFQREEIAQLYDLFSFLGATKPWGDRFLRHPLVGLQTSTAQALEAHKDSLLEITTGEGLEAIGVGNPQDRRTILPLLELKRRAQAKEHGSLVEVFYSLLAITGCVGRFENAGGIEALGNLGEMSQLVARWDEYGSTRNFYPFQEYLKLLKEGGLDPVLLPPKDALRIMTIHQAKGLGFPVVVLGAAMKGRLPTSPRRQRYEIPPELTASGLPEVKDPHTVDERKLFYVAATRARDLLVVGTADVVEKRGGGPSPFVVEMFGEDLHAAADLARAYVEEVESRPVALLEPMKRHNFSEMAYFLQCPMRYKFAVVYGFAAPWMDPVDFGANVHRALESLHQRCREGHVPSEGEVREIIEETWISGTRATPEQEAGLKDAAEKQIRRYLREHASSLTAILEAETSFAFSLKGRVVSGKIDLIRSMDDPGGAEIVDFKTSKSAPLHEGRVDLQLGLYALGVEATLGRAVARCTAHFLGDGQRVSSAWSMDLGRAAQEELAAVLEAVERGEFPPNREYCPSCQEFSAICPYAG